MTTQEYLRQLLGKDQVIDLAGKCHDCKADVLITVALDNGQLLSTGAFWHIEGIGDFCKCEPCYEANEMLTNFRPCEVYSRSVGYLRPVKQWNLGKKEEFKMRKPFDMHWTGDEVNIK